MTRTLARYALPFLLCIGAQAATTQTTLTVTANVHHSRTSITATGTATLRASELGPFTARYL